jgi:hypothetical protein
MKKILLFTFTLCALWSEAQQSVSALSVENNHFIINNLGQYLVADQEGLHLVDKTGKVLYQFSENLLGNISALDYTTSMRPMIFYDEIPAFQVLDNTLSPHSEVIELIDLGLGNVTHMCTSSNNGFWTYDPVGFELKRLDEQLEVLAESGNVYSVLESEMEVMQILERGNILFVRDENEGIHMFDYYGTFIRTIEGSYGCGAFDVSEEHIFFMQDGSLIQQKLNDLVSFEEPKRTVIDLNAVNGNVHSVTFSNGEIFLGTQEEISRVLLNENR